MSDFSKDKNATPPRSNDKARAARSTSDKPASTAPEHDDSALESIGKAISAPVIGAAEPEEPDATGKPPVKPGD